MREITLMPGEAFTLPDGTIVRAAASSRSCTVPPGTLSTEYAYPDWQAILSDLKGAGITQAAIAAYVGVAQSAISQLNLGKTEGPRHAVGAKILALHSQSRGAA